jgi:predicted dehydrogenase
MKSRFPPLEIETLESLLGRPDVDAVIIAAPTGEHATVASAAFRARKHVYLEKPLATTAEEGRRIVDAWRNAGTVGMVGYNFRRSPVFERAKLELDSGALGSLIQIQGTFLWAAEQVEGWRADPGEGGGVLLDLASHHVDLVVALTGSRVRDVRCNLRSVRTPEDSATLEITLEGGITAQLFASFAIGAQVNRLELLGSSGSLSVDLLDPVLQPVDRPPGRGARVIRARRALSGLHPLRLLRSPGHEPSFRTSLQVFLQACVDGSAVEPTPETALHTVGVIEAARASAEREGARCTVTANHSPSSH